MPWTSSLHQQLKQNQTHIPNAPAESFGQYLESLISSQRFILPPKNPFNLQETNSKPQINWNAVLATDGCPYGSESSIRVTFNKLKNKLGLANPNAKGADAATAGATDGTSDGTPQKKATPRTPRKKKEDAAGSAAKKTPSKVAKAPSKRKSSVNKEALEAAAMGEDDSLIDAATTPSSEEPFDMSTPKRETKSEAIGEANGEASVEEEFGTASMFLPEHPAI